MSDSPQRQGVDLILMGSGLLAGVGATTPLWWQNMLTALCHSQNGLVASNCNGKFAEVVEGCRECQSYGPSVLVPVLVALVSFLAFAGKLKDSLSF